VASGADLARARAGPIREGGGAVSALALTCSARGELMILILSLQIKECLSRKLSLGSFGSDFFDISGRLLVKIEAPWQGTLDLNAFFYIAGTYKSTRHAHSNSAPLFSISCKKKKNTLCGSREVFSGGVFSLLHTQIQKNMQL